MEQQQNQPVFLNTENENSLMRYQISVDQTLEEIRLMLLGISFDYVKKEYTNGKPLYLPASINRIMDITKSFINKELVLSGFTNENINNLIRNGMITLSLYLVNISSDERNVQDKELNNMVLNTILNHAFSNMKRALDYKTLVHAGKAKISAFDNPIKTEGYPIRDNPSRGGWR